MKNLTTLLAIIFMASSTIFASSILEDEKENIPIPIQIGDLENTHLFRTPIVIPIECWYYGSVNSIFINCLTPINNLKVRVQNMETGEMSVEEYESVSSSLLIPFANIPGCYNIELVVNKSQSFIGSFEVE